MSGALIVVQRSAPQCLVVPRSAALRCAAHIVLNQALPTLGSASRRAAPGADLPHIRRRAEERIIVLVLQCSAVHCVEPRGTYCAGVTAVLRHGRRRALQRNASRRSARPCSAVHCIEPRATYFAWAAADLATSAGKRKGHLARRTSFPHARTHAWLNGKGWRLSTSPHRCWRQWRWCRSSAPIHNRACAPSLLHTWRVCATSLLET